MSAVCDQISQEIGELFSCTQLDSHVQARTPFLYPDGDVIDVYLKQSDSSGAPATLSDLGESLRWLRMQSVSQRRTKKQQSLIDDVTLTEGVEVFRGMVTVRVRPGERLAEAVVRLAEACIRVADLWFIFRTRTVQMVTDEVEELLQERQIPFSRGERLVGRSGRSWTIDFHTRTPTRSSLVCVLATGSKCCPPGRRARARDLVRPDSHAGGARVLAAGVALRRPDGRLGSRGLSSAGDGLVGREMVQAGRIR
ncbi:MAG: DUF1828 domain-containing protein [bacterium]